MNQRIWKGLTATVLTTTLGTATSSYAQPTKAENPGFQESPAATHVHSLPTTANLVSEQRQVQPTQKPVNQGSQGSPTATPRQGVPKTATPVSEQRQVQPTQAVKVGELQSQSARADQGEVIAKIQGYEMAGRQVATLYVRGVPVLTFLGARSIAANDTKMGEAALGSDRTSLRSNQKTASRNQMEEDAVIRREISPASDASNGPNDPVWRATAVAARLNQLSRNGVDAKAIAAHWNARCNCYSIRVKNDELVQINQTTILADTTRNLATDALQATNRLRRLIGNAPPLREIVGRPAARNVATASLGPVRFQISGIASWYGPGFHGNRTAAGERYNQNAMTAAHKTLPFGTRVVVTNLNNGRSVVVRINDRGPFIRGRVIDLSAAAARMLGMMQSGIAPVKVDVLGKPDRIATDD
ncbi:MAG TPA: septal ring lytic transglycosylase RlpA family protein [Cyanobacteria bacterium UBA8553]|nr:septal ring lytic transglycosylase RlpA family protein [Cyanobacteria bacterium UBA8553]HAJ63955.1 septal ring lytic transglycosylase RlpA family protein [Cyanobacteria bacterium UBA8543]